MLRSESDFGTSNLVYRDSYHGAHEVDLLLVDRH